MYREHLLSSKTYELVTDHQALKYSFRKKYIHLRIACCMGLLAEYDLEIIYRFGKNNGAGDYLSRIELLRTYLFYVCVGDFPGFNEAGGQPGL